MIKVLLPEPETPVTHTKIPKGISQSIFLRLFSSAPKIFIVFPLLFLLFEGDLICFVPERYCPVKDFLDLMIWFKVPLAITSPPNSPAPGPMSIMWSADLMIASSCSTINTVFPTSLKFFNVVINLSSSAGCNPIEGSSQTYKTPINPDPICVANLILWDSPPLNVEALRDKDR